MPTTDKLRVPEPTIEPLRSEIIGNNPDRIAKTTLIQITSENHLHKIYFTTDGTNPDAFNRHVNKREVTHKYSGPFALKPGVRIVKAVAYTRNGKYCSEIAGRSFEVLSTDSALSNIGEEDDTSTLVSSDSSQVTRTSKASRASRSGRPSSARYMERLKDHLDADLALTDLDFETPRTIQEMLEGVETPHTDIDTEHHRRALVKYSASGEDEEEEDLSAVEKARLRELEEERQRDLERERRRELGRLERLHLEEEGECCSQCEEGDNQTTVTDFFVRPTRRSHSPTHHHHDRRYLENGTSGHRSEIYRSTSPHRVLTDKDYGISGTTPRLSTQSTPGLYNQTSAHHHGFSTSATNGSHQAYRAQVDRELDARVQGTKPYLSHQPLTSSLPLNTSAYNSTTSAYNSSSSPYNSSTSAYNSSTRPTYTITSSAYRAGDDCCTECCGGGEVHDPTCRECHRETSFLPTRRLSRSRSRERSTGDIIRRLSRSRSREHSPVGILKRGRSLEREEGHYDYMGRRRSRSAGRNRSRSRERGYRRGRSPSPGRRHALETQSDFETYIGGDTYRTDDFDLDPPRKEVTFSDQEGIPRQRRRSRSRERRPTSLERRPHKETEESLEEIDEALQFFEQNNNRGRRAEKPRPRSRSRERERSAKALKNQKDHVNMKKSTAAKAKIIKPFPSSSSSSSSLSSSSDEESKSKKEETEKEKRDKDKEKETKLKNSSKKTSQQLRQKVQEPRRKLIQPKPPAPVEPVMTIDDIDIHSENENEEETNSANTKKNAGLNFYNDSGTQINFWGVSPDEIAKRLQENPEMKSVVEQAVGVGNSQQSATEDDTEYETDNNVDHFFMTETRGRQGRQGRQRQQRPQVKPQRRYQAFTQAQAFAQNYEEDSEDVDGDMPEPESTGVSTGVRKQAQQSQHSFFGKIKKFFTGSGDDDNDSKPVANLKKVDYTKVKKECLKKKKLWEDPDFPAQDSSLFSNQEPPMYPFEWKRPGQIGDKPQMVAGGASRFDVKQGCLGDCWLLAAIASLAGEEKLLARVVPTDHRFDKDYAGIVRFKLWQYGEWVDVCIDDRLPTKAGKLVYMHSDDPNEFWSPLLEKAYAKLCGCYENLSGGLASEALTDFIGGVVEPFNFKQELPDNIFHIMLKAHQRGSLMGCSIDADAAHREEQLDNGLIIGHAYSITDVKQINSKKGEVNLLRVRNPWGNESEWNGAWSDDSSEWQSINDKTKKKLGLVKDHDGEFWMSARDFTTYFQRVEICHQDKSGTGALESTFITGAWVKKANAGGCLNNPETYWTNPQYRVTVTDMDDDDEEEIGTIIVGLMQKGRRRLRASGGGNLTVGFDIYSLGPKDKEGTMDKKFFRKNQAVASSSFVNSREVTGRFRLAPGQYLIVPATFDADEEAEFLLRIYSEKEAGLFESDTPTSVNPNVTAKSMSVAHSAPPRDQEISKRAEAEFVKAAGEDEEVDAYELHTILNSFFTQGFNFGEFNINSCRSMVAIRDADSTGMLGLEEFKELWNDLNLWKLIFKKFDKDNSGAFCTFELREALKSAGYNVSNKTFMCMVKRFSDREGKVKFDDFVDCIVRLKTLFELYKKNEDCEHANFSLDKFMESLMYT